MRDIEAFVDDGEEDTHGEPIDLDALVECPVCGESHEPYDVIRVPPNGCPNTSCQLAKDHNHRLPNGRIAGPDDLEEVKRAAAQVPLPWAA